LLQVDVSPAVDCLQLVYQADPIAVLLLHAYIDCPLLFSLFPISSIPLKCILVSGFGVMMDGSFVTDRLEAVLAAFGEFSPWKRMPGWIYLSKSRDRNSWLRAETGVGVLSRILFSLMAL
jgi:hypothetical protein